MNKQEKYVKSPLNYTGGKFKLLPQLTELFPSNINTLLDLFGGGGNVCANVTSKRVIYNDIMGQIPILLEKLKETSVEHLLIEIEELITKYSLDRENKEGYLALRKEYNKTKDVIMLYALICHSFSNQVRFNKKGEFNMPFGERTFNDKLKKNFIEFVDKLHEINIEFTNKDFREISTDYLGENDFVYCDPPYLITCASYNENEGWNDIREKELLSLLDKLDEQGVKFALSNVLESKGRENELLKEWSKKYNIHYLNHSYKNCNYHKKDRTQKDIEVLITNY